MLKYGGTELTLHLTQLFKQILKLCKAPKAWKESIIGQLFKKGSKTNPDNYRGITLLITALKLFTKFSLSKLLKYIQPREQQDFRKNRSTTDAIFIMRQIVEKSIEFNKPAYLCFVDLKKAFVRVGLADGIECLRERELPKQIVRIIK
jgi:hypothetical protein